MQHFNPFATPEEVEFFRLQVCHNKCNAPVVRTVTFAINGVDQLIPLCADCEEHQGA